MVRVFVKLIYQRLKLCLNLFSQMAKTIYIEGVFAEKWEYEVFKMLASEYNYNFRLVEMQKL